MIISRDCWAYQKQYTCKGGFINQCTDYQDNCQLQNQNCLSRDNNGVCTYNTNTYQCQSLATQTNVSCGSQDYITFNQDHNFGRAAASLGLLQGAAKEFNKDNMTTFSGSGSKCSKSAVSFNNCCSQSGWGNDLSLASCSSAEENLAVLRSNQRCVYVGSYCAKKVAGLCLSTKESYCCFNSKLSRIVNEQGRSQIGMDFGSAKNPNCAGILINDLQQIDFSKVDFSELFADFTNNTQIPDSQVNSDRVSSTVQEHYRQSQSQDDNLGQNQGKSQKKRQSKGQGKTQSQVKSQLDRSKI
jgi:conjugal transfer mating pair stabilization protein TraN